MQSLTDYSHCSFNDREEGVGDKGGRERRSGGGEKHVMGWMDRDKERRRGESERETDRQTEKDIERWAVRK